LSLSRDGDYVIPVFKSCFIRPGTSCAGDNLKDVNLSGANLANMDFTGAYMKNAKLTVTLLDGANFTDAYMKGADFSDAKGVRTKLGARSLADANFSRVTLNFPEATGTSFLRSKWIEAKVEKGDFSSSNFYKANFKDATLVKTDFRATKLRGVSWDGAVLLGGNFIGAER
jgi:uncharacterized protein YjbI with pentapeptide repeats